MMDIHYTEDALKDLRKIGRSEASRIIHKINQYAGNPQAFRNQVKKLQGIHALRLRIGNYRVLFTEDGIILEILRIGHRREVYR